MKSLLLLSCLSLSICCSAFADDDPVYNRGGRVACMDHLTNRFNVDSRFTRVRNGEEWAETMDERLVQARQYILDQFGPYGCTRSVLLIDLKDTRYNVCKELVPGDSSTTSCYYTSTVGYFFVTRDYVDSFNIIYNRWD